MKQNKIAQLFHILTKIKIKSGNSNHIETKSNLSVNSFHCSMKSWDQQPYEQNLCLALDILLTFDNQTRDSRELKDNYSTFYASNPKNRDKNREMIAEISESE